MVGQQSWNASLAPVGDVGNTCGAVLVEPVLHVYWCMSDLINMYNVHIHCYLVGNVSDAMAVNWPWLQAFSTYMELHKCAR